MASPIVYDRVKETTTTTGTGTVTLAGAVTGYQSFSVVGNTNTTYYTIENPSLGEWEVGQGTYTSAGTTLSRDTILASSNSGNAVNFSAGTKGVFITIPAFLAGLGNSNGSSVLSGNFSLTSTGTFQDTGLSVSLPTAGTYAINCDVRGQLFITAGAGFITSKLRNTTDAADISNSERLVLYTAVLNLTFINTISAVTFVTVTAAKTIGLFAKRDDGGSVAFTSALISTDANGRTVLSYHRIY